ncbi:MAG: hypothetical protein KBG67_06150, partial [Candidatus Atribacteria bacterium]|nr:hypothetical protein [Candidatus Atribacteria bacterium]
MPKIKLLLGCILLFGSLLAQESALPEAVIQENDTTETALPDSIAEVKSQVEIPIVPLTPTQLPSETLTEEPAQPEPAPEELQPPEEVLPALVASQK